MCAGVPISLSTSTAARRALLFVAQDADQVADRVGMVRAHDGIDGLLVAFDVGVAQHFAEQADVRIRAPMPESALSMASAHELVRVLELPRERLVRLRAG